MTNTIKYCIFCEQKGVSCANTRWEQQNKKLTNKKGKGCKTSHGRCTSCADMENKPLPFFACNLDTWNTNIKKAWTKQKGMKKQFNLWLKRELKNYNRELLLG